MKRWFIRLGALSTVALSGLLYYANVSKGPVKASAVEEPVATVQPIPLIADDEPDPSTPATSNPFAARSKLIDTVEPAAVGDRYAAPIANDPQSAEAEPPSPGGRYETVGYQEQPAEAAATPTAEPRQLPTDDQATDISNSRNPFDTRTAVAGQGDRYARAAASSERATSSQEPVAPTETIPNRYDQSASEGAATPEPAIAEQAEATPPLVPVAQMPRQAATTALDRGLPPSAAAAPAAVTPFGRAVDAPADTSAFERPATAGTAAATAPGGTGKPGSRNLEGAQAPSLTIEKSAPAEISVGKPATFLIHVRNVGQVAASDVEVHDRVPQGTQLIATKPTAIESQGSLLWQLGTLKPGDETTLEMQVMPTSEGEVGSVASVTFRTDASVRTKVTRPQLKLDVVAPAKVLIGETAQLHIRLSNPGTGAATGIVLTETIPAGLKHEGGRELEFEVGTLAPGASRELALTLTAVQPGIAANVLRAVGDANLEAEDRDDIDVVAPALKLSLDGPSRRFLQRNATYEITLHNPGTAAAKNIELTAVLPRGMRFVEANNQGQYDATAHRVAWSLEELPPGESGKVSLTMLAAEPGDLRLQVQGKAEMDLQDTIEEAISVEGVAAIVFEVVDAQDPIELGGEALYEIRVTNQGSAPATNVQLVALLPPEMTALEADGPVQHTLEPHRVLFSPLGQLAPKADTLYTVKARGDAPGDLRLRVQIVTDEIKTPVTKEESTRVYADE